MLKLYDHLQAFIEQQQYRQRFIESRLPYFANEIMKTLQIEDDDEMEVSLKRTFEACAILHIPIAYNFKRVYLFDGKTVIADWKVSALAQYLIIINCNPANEQVAAAQLFFAMKNLKLK